MKTKNIFRMLLVAAALLMGANNVKADNELLFHGTKVGGICYQGHQGGSTNITIDLATIKDADPAIGNKIKIVASKNVDDGSEGRYRLQIVNSSYLSFDFSDWDGENDGQTILDTNESENDHSTYFEFTLSKNSIDRMTNVNNVGGGIIINFLGLTITEVWLIKEADDPNATFSISIDEDILHGSLISEQTKAKKDDIIILTATSEVGYKLNKILVNGSSAGVTITNTEQNENGSYTYEATFAMPARATTVSAIFVENNTIWYDDPQTIVTIPASEFVGIPENSVLRIYTGMARIGLNNTWYEENVINNNGLYKSGGYFEIVLTQPMLDEYVTDDTGLRIEKGWKDNAQTPITKVTLTRPTPPVSHNITYSSNNAHHGSFAENNPTEAIAGNTVTVEIEEDEGWLGIVTATYGDDNTSLNVSTGTQAGQYTFIMPDADVSVYLSFERLYTVTADATEHGTINLANETYFRANAEYSFSVTPADNYEISADDISVYTGEGEDREEIEFTQRSGSSNSYFFTMPEANVHISATFHAVQHEPVEITLAFSASRVEYDINSSTAFVAPTLTANGQAVSADLGIVYSSSRTSVAEVDPVTGEVEIYGTGTTVITATFPDDSNYTGSAEYTLYVYEIAEDGDWEEVSFVNGETTYEYRTYVTPGVIDFGRSDHVEAYYATGYDDEVVEFTQVLSTCAAGTPLLLKKTGNNCKLWLLTDDDATGSELTGNLLRPGSTNEEGEAEEVSGPNKYVLTIHNEEPVFAEVKNHAANVDANHAYLYLGTNAPASGRLRVKFSDESTGISTIEAETTNDGVIYNLRGQRVENPTKGLYIINGKKVVIK